MEFGGFIGWMDLRDVFRRGLELEIQLGQCSAVKSMASFSSYVSTNTSLRILVLYRQPKFLHRHSHRHR